MKERCAICKINYPEGILWNDICGICALEQSNEIHKATGIVRKKFDGEMAEEFRQEAVAYRKSHKQ